MRMFVRVPQYALFVSVCLLSIQPVLSADDETTTPRVIYSDETDEDATTTTPTTTRPRITKAAWNRFALFYCERMKECNVIPKNRVCGVEYNTQGPLWFENICTMWKSNCLEIAMFLEAPAAKCEGSSSVMTNKAFDSNWFQPLGYNPYYTHDRNKICK